MFLNRVFRQKWFNRFLWFLASLIRKNGRTLRKFYLFSYRYRVFSLAWPASTQIYWNKRKRLHKKRVQLPEDWFGTPIWPPWRHVKTLYKNVWDIGISLKTAFLQKCQEFKNPKTDFSLTSANKPQSSLVLYPQVWSQSWPCNSLHK